MTARLTEAKLLERMEELSGIHDPHTARWAMAATISALGESLPAAVRDQVGKSLPPALCEILAAVESAAEPQDLPTFFERARVLAGSERRFAAEQVEIVCRMLGELLPQSTVAAIERALPELVATLFEAPHFGRPSPRQAVQRSPHTLAAGRPGTTHPLSTSRPAPAQHDSVASDNPHGNRKLSSST